MSDVRGWIDASFGASGDMLLAAFLDAGADERFVTASVRAVAPEQVTITTERVRRNGIAALRAHVTTTESTTERSLSDVRALLHGARLDGRVRALADATFGELAGAEAEVHGTSVEEVHFHEVGALDAIADIVGVCAAVVSLDLVDALSCSPIAVGSGTVETRHGLMSVPPPAVARLLRNSVIHAGPAVAELCTPTAAALISQLAGPAGAPLQPMTISAVGTGAGRRDFDGHPNVVRVFVGTYADSGRPDDLAPKLYETNVDDLDPRLWPNVLAKLLQAGASDAWLTPILMKKGRAAYTLSVLVPADRTASVQTVIFGETSTIGLRTQTIDKIALDRDETTVQVEDSEIRVKVARHRGRVVNVQPEYDDVARVAGQFDLPIKSVLAQAIAAARHLWEADDQPEGP